MDWDLKLGGLGEIGAAANNRDVGKVPEATALSSPGAAKAKLPFANSGGSGSGSGSGAGKHQRRSCSCVVDGCTVDLSTCRKYHRRYKVCEAHAKTSVVTVDGREVRFCQQCSRFHLLTEFDEAKRSCRKGLDEHNRRRRKPLPDYRNFEYFMIDQQGQMFSSFPTPRPEENWPGHVKTGEDLYYTHQNLPGTSNRQRFFGSSSTNAQEGRHFPFLLGGGINFAPGVRLETSLCQPLHKPVAPLESRSRTNLTFSDGLTPVLDSDSALALLSDPATSSGVDVCHIMQQAEYSPFTQPWFSNLKASSSSSSSRSQAYIGIVSAAGFPNPMVGNEQLNIVLSSDNTDINYNGIFPVGGKGSLGDVTSSPPFPWQ